MTQYSDEVTKTERAVIRTVCNGCNEETPKGYSTHVSETGGYESAELRDLNRYEFDLCERCLVRVMDGLQVPPDVHEVAVDGYVYPTAISYAKDRDGHREQRAKELASKQDREARRAAGKCTESCRPEGNNFELIPCTAEAIAKADGDPVCAFHMIEAYDGTATVEWHGSSSSHQERSFVAARMIRAIRAGECWLPDSDIESIVLTGTLLCMLVEPTCSRFAYQELRRPYGEIVDGAHKWIHERVALTFPPGDAFAATVNDWLWWGKRKGYTESVACVCLGYSVERHWHLPEKEEMGRRT